MTGLPVLAVYTRPGCHLCEILIEELLPLAAERATVDVRNIDTRDEWQAAYAERIPVVELDGRCLSQYRLDRGAVLTALADYPGVRPAAGRGDPAV